MIEGENRLEQMKRVLAEKQRERMQIQTASSRGGHVTENILVN